MVILSWKSLRTLQFGNSLAKLLLLRKQVDKYENFGY